MRTSQQALRASIEAEAEQAVTRDQRLHRVGFGSQHADPDAIAPLARGQRLERLGEVATGVEREDVDARAGPGNGVQNGLVFQPQARRERDAAGELRGDRSDTVLEASEGGQPFKQRLRGRRALGPRGGPRRDR